MRTPTRRFVSIALGGAFATLGWAAVAFAQDTPSPPSFAYLYGQALIGGENLAPTAQPVVAFVNGKSCGGVASETFIATAGENVPTEDVGKTVYVIDVLADGTKNYERPGCGHAGESILLWFPASGRMSSQQPLFQPGPQRANLELDIVLPFRAGIPSVASDRTN